MLTVRELIKALADREPTDEVVIGKEPVWQAPRTPIARVSSVHRVIAGKPRRVERYVVLIGKEED
jgi:hypothetical protein